MQWLINYLLITHMEWACPNIKLFVYRFKVVILLDMGKLKTRVSSPRTKRRLPKKTVPKKPKRFLVHQTKRPKFQTLLADYQCRSYDSISQSLVRVPFVKFDSFKIDVSTFYWGNVYVFTFESYFYIAAPVYVCTALTRSLVVGFLFKKIYEEDELLFQDGFVARLSKSADQSLFLRLIFVYSSLNPYQCF